MGSLFCAHANTSSARFCVRSSDGPRSSIGADKTNAKARTRSSPIIAPKLQAAAKLLTQRGIRVDQGGLTKASSSDASAASTQTSINGDEFSTAANPAPCTDAVGKMTLPVITLLLVGWTNHDRICAL